MGNAIVRGKRFVAGGASMVQEKYSVQLSSEEKIWLRQMIRDGRGMAHAIARGAHSSVEATIHSEDASDGAPV